MGPKTPASSVAPTAAHAVSPGIARVTVLIPARDEASNVAETIESLRGQTRPADHIIVIDDGSNDGTGDVALAHGIEVLRLARPSGSKSAALNAALDHVRTELVLVIDADTTLAPDALGRIMAPMRDPRVAAACGHVKPRRIRTVWERARLIDYLLSCEIAKPLQDQAGALLVLTGCFSVYRADVLRRYGGWRAQSVAEDMDLTWTLQRDGHSLRYVRDAICYSLEPADARLMQRQLRRWSRGFCQNLKLHWPGLLEQPYLRSFVIVSFVSRIADAALVFVATPLLTLLVHPLFLLLLALDVPATWLPAVVLAWRQGGLDRVLPSLPCTILQRLLSSAVFVGAVWSELVQGRSMRAFEKGH